MAKKSKIVRQSLPLGEDFNFASFVPDQFHIIRGSNADLEERVNEIAREVEEDYDQVLIIDRGVMKEDDGRVHAMFAIVGKKDDNYKSLLNNENAS